MESQCDGFSSSDVCCDERSMSLNATKNQSSPVNRFPSTSIDSPSSSIGVSARSQDDLTVKLQHLFPPLYHRVHQHQQVIEARDATGPYRLALWEAIQCREANGLWSAWRSPLTPTPPLLQLLALYRVQFWTQLVSSLLGVDFMAAAAAVIAASATTHNQQSFDRLPPATQLPTVPGGQYTACDQWSIPSTDAALADDGAARSRNSLVNWLIDSSSSRSFTSSSATASATFGETPHESAFDAARRLLELMREHRRFCTDAADDLGGVDLHQGHVRGIGFSGQQHCGRATMSRAALDAARVGGFSCRLCFKRYATPGAIKMHTRTHTLPCRCLVCGKAFSRPWLLQGHLRTHTGERPYACSLCQRAFADRSNLRAHLQTHVAVKKYACSRCSRTFSRMSLLVKHMYANACPRRTPPF